MTAPEDADAPDPATLIGELTGLLAELERAVALLTNGNAAQAERMDLLESDVALHGTQLTGLATATGRLDDLETALQAITDLLADPKRPAVFRWERLTAASAATLWGLFTAWVDDLDRWYDYPEIPGCPQWWTHRGLIEELTALWIEWRFAYRPKASATDPRFFHEALYRARERCKHIAQSCTRTSHTDLTERDLPERAPSFDDAAALWPLAPASPYTPEHPETPASQT